MKTVGLLLLTFASVVYVKGFVCPQENGQFAHETDCEKYWNCWKSEAFIGECKLGLLFEAERRICLDADMVDCGDRIVPKIDYKPTEECPKPVGLFPKKENCAQYYHCVGGEPFLKNCPHGLLYDPENEWCDFPNRVDCGDRPVLF
ncbi:peritrophin-1-like isoform X2 [Limulus polyphemus]|uniref:Peritrophin-1-like isoform X2 n=1 Tax=Limulus polyphemus TaxID=6850 RepID=A0ABM1B645_LIMPO|nr:peritrophin-1-like isoform X2 [Limulus polyphemus]